MAFIGRALVVGALALFVSACTTVSLPYDRSSAGTESIAVVTPAQPSGPTAILASSVDKSFGLIGP